MIAKCLSHAQTADCIFSAVSSVWESRWCSASTRYICFNKPPSSLFILVWCQISLTLSPLQQQQTCPEITLHFLNKIHFNNVSVLLVWKPISEQLWILLYWISGDLTSAFILLHMVLVARPHVCRGERERPGLSKQIRSNTLPHNSIRGQCNLQCCRKHKSMAWGGQMATPRGVLRCPCLGQY